MNRKPVAILELVWLAFTCFCLPPFGTNAVTVTAVTSDNGYPAHKIQWTDSAGLPRTAIMVDQNLTTPPYTGYLRRYSYQVNSVTRTCTGTQNYATGGNLEFSGDGFVQNHTASDGDVSSGNGAGFPGTTTITQLGTNFVMIQYDMPNYTIYGPYYSDASPKTIPTTVQWFFADGRSHPIFAISQDARNGGGNLGADSRSPYGDMAYDGDGVGAYVGGCSYGDTYKFVTLAANQVTTNSGWSYNQVNTIPYAMQWANPATVDAEMGHVATLPIALSDQGVDSQIYNTDGNNQFDSRYADYRTLSAPNGPMMTDLAWAFQVLNDNWPASGPTTTKRLAWGANYGRLGGYDDGYFGTSGIPDNELTNYSQHATEPVGNPAFPAYKGIGSPSDGTMMAYSVFVVLGTHTGGYTNGTVGQVVIQMQNATQATLAATLGTVAASGPAGVGNATNRTITYTPAGYDPTYAAWAIKAKTNAVNATLAVTTDYPLDHPIFVINNYTNSQLPASIAVGSGLTNAGVNYFASVDTNNHILWITVNRLVTNSLNLVVSPTADSGGGGTVQPAPVVSSFAPASGPAGTAVTVTGQNFTNATIVAFNGVAAAFTIVSATQITTTVPVGAGSGPVSVTTPGGAANSTASFTVVPPPFITSFAPATGLAGTQVIITGQNFTGATNVTFNGAAAGFTVNSATQITATVPAGAGTGLIVVATPAGASQTTAAFTVPAATTNLPVYLDSLLNGFQDYSWATNVNDFNTAPVYSGSDSIRVTASQYTALSLYHADFNTAPYASLSFFINGGAAGASGLQVMGVTNLLTTQNYAAIYNLPALAPNTWTHFNVPLAALGVANVTNCQGFWFWPTLSGATTFYVDSIQMNVAAPPALALAPSAPGFLVFQLGGLSGQTNWVQTSTNLINWTSVATNILIAASANVTNTVNTRQRTQFWRVVQLP